MNNIHEPVSTIIKSQYDEWVNRVCAFLSEIGPTLGEKGTHCATFQSKPVLDKHPDVVFLGFNPDEAWEYYEEDSTPKRFYEGNEDFYKNRDNKRIWRVWKYEDSFKWANYTTPVEDGRFVFFNAIYFGTKRISDFLKIKGAPEAMDKCLEYTREVIQEIFKPKCVVCFSVRDCFDRLSQKFSFAQIKLINTREETAPNILNEALYRTDNKKWKSIHTCSKPVKKGLWDSIPVYGIPHPSSRISVDDMGAVALYLKSEMQKLGI